MNHHPSFDKHYGQVNEILKGILVTMPPGVVMATLNEA